MNRLIIENLAVRYGKTEILKGMSAVFAEGVTAVLGANGAGKTTLFKALSTLLPIAGGRIELGGLSKPADLRKRLGYVPQNFGFYPYLTVKETIEHFAILRGLAKREIAGAVSEALECTNLSGEASKKVGALSGGMTRRLGIAQAMVTRPALLLIDEPTAGLDPDECTRFRMLLRRLPGGTIVLFSTHIVDDLSACDAVCVMREGNCRNFASVAELAKLARGHVRKSVMTPQEANAFSAQNVVSSVSPHDNGVLVRWLDAGYNELSPEANAEDGYVWASHF